ncbi:hypothetical protein Acr_05g0010680 [Actinidia rufa]|uniref:Uncharacterized protein n=1 Tax=Actinidia rufa TaxID=165716 RepID=A0A7J0EN71_9ERIC|nr:hypothetical protein Acr_05g0010680 [Actinidia rufa]
MPVLMARTRWTTGSVAAGFVGALAAAGLTRCAEAASAPVTRALAAAGCARQLGQRPLGLLCQGFLGALATGAGNEVAAMGSRLNRCCNGWCGSKPATTTFAATTRQALTASNEAGAGNEVASEAIRARRVVSAADADLLSLHVLEAYRFCKSVHEEMQRQQTSNRSGNDCNDYSPSLTSSNEVGAGNVVAADVVRARRVVTAIVAAAVGGLLPLHFFVDASAKSIGLYGSKPATTTFAATTRQALTASNEAGAGNERQQTSNRSGNDCSDYSPSLTSSNEVGAGNDVAADVVRARRVVIAIVAATVLEAYRFCKSVHEEMQRQQTSNSSGNDCSDYSPSLTSSNEVGAGNVVAADVVRARRVVTAIVAAAVGGFAVAAFLRGRFCKINRPLVLETTRLFRLTMFTSRNTCSGSKPATTTFAATTRQALTASNEAGAGNEVASDAIRARRVVSAADADLLDYSPILTASNEAGAGNDVATDVVRARRVVTAIVAATVAGLLPLHFFRPRRHATAANQQTSNLTASNEAGNEAAADAVRARRVVAAATNISTLPKEFGEPY